MKDTELFYLLCGVGVSVMSSLVHSLSSFEIFSLRGTIKALASALSCGFLTLGFAIILKEYFALSYIWSVAIGAFSGQLGAIYITALASTYIQKKFINGDLDDNK